MKLSQFVLSVFIALGCGLLITTANSSESKIGIVPDSSDHPITITKVDESSDNSPAPKATARLWNLQDADILSVINEVSQETGKNFVVDPRVTGKITLVSSKPLHEKDVYQVFLSVLGILGYSAVPTGSVIKIVPNMESGEQATMLASKQSPGQGDEVVVRVIPLESVSATQLIPAIRPLLPQWSNVSVYSPGNVLILLGRASNIERIAGIISDVDKASSSSIQMIQLHHASASQVATVLNNLQTASRTAGDTQTVSIAVDERTNSILIGGPKAARLRMRVLVSQLDSQPTTSSGNTEVVYLRYLQAKTLAPLLGKIAQNILGKDTSAADAVTTIVSTSNMNGGSTGISKSMAKEPANTTNIQAEPNTNALIITASPALMTAIKSVIAKLDIRPKQVLVESIIAEIDESNISSLGIQWGSVTPTTTSANGSSSSSSQGMSITSFPAFGAGVVGIMPNVQIQAVLSMLQNLNGVDILSTPSIMVLDNQKATIEIGQDVPFQTGSYAQTGSTSTVTPFSTVDQKPVTLKLDVIPQINLGRSVRMKLNLKNDTLQNPQNPGLNPIINTSKISNAVIVNSDDVLVIGGLMSNSNNENINKVPILGDLPILGKILFQQKTNNQTKKNLMVFIKPIIMLCGDDSNTITNMKYEEVRSIQGNYSEDLATIGKAPLHPMLPPWKNSRDLPKPFGADSP